MHNPLDGVDVKQSAASLSQGASGVYQYFLKVVPTSYRQLGGTTIASNQFALTEHFREAHPGYGQQLPGLFIFHDLSPIKVTRGTGGGAGRAPAAGGRATALLLVRFLLVLAVGPAAVRVGSPKHGRADPCTRPLASPPRAGRV